MPRSTPDIDFERIRPYGRPSSRASGFEELASILIKNTIVDWPAGTQFHRYGNPDGGREGKGVLPNGDVWAWQVKHLFAFDSRAAALVKESFVRTLGLEPNLKKYFVAFPIDLAAGDTDRAKSASTLWGEKVEEWKALALNEGLTVDFVFIGAHELTTSLTQAANEGRARYWFDADLLSDADQTERIEEVAAKLGRRYSPQLHVEVDAAQAMDAIGRTSAFVGRWQQILAKLRAATYWRWSAPAGDGEAYEAALSSCAVALPLADTALQNVVTSASTLGDLTDPTKEVAAATTAVEIVSDLLHERARSESGSYTGGAATLFVQVRDALSALYDAQALCTSTITRAAREAELLLTGKGGVGKSHLLCDVAKRRVAAHQPTLMILGQDLDDQELVSQLPRLAQVVGSADDLLSLLDAAAEASESRGLLIIDALNESDRPDRWASAIAALRTKARRYPRVGLVLSCRTEFVDAVTGTTDLPTFSHPGFAEATDAAVRRFASEYDLDVPTFPVLNPEFGNPFFLRLACEALSALGMDRFVLGSAGLSTVCSAFVEATNLRLSRPARCDFDDRKGVVQAVVEQLAALGGTFFDRAEVEQVTLTLLPGDRPWSRSLMKGLLDEGILIEAGSGRISFGYQRLGDVARAAQIATKADSEITAWLRSLDQGLWRERGTVAALAVILPETHGLEIIDLATSEDGVRGAIVESFIEGLTLRDPMSITDRTIQIVEHLLASKRYDYETWTQLVRLACVPDHTLNATWLHDHLVRKSLTERDTTWSIWLLGQLEAEEHSPVRTLIEWAWPLDLKASAVPPVKTAELAMLTLGWTLSTSDRSVRDHATKALVALGENDPSGFIEVLGHLLKANDPYVVERMAAAACGVAMRNKHSEYLSGIADCLSEFISPGWPPHLLTRDYVRRVFELARQHGWTGQSGEPPYGTQWPIEPTPRGEIDKLVAAPDYRYSSIWHSLTGMGDFGKYVLRPALRDFVPTSKSLVDVAERALFDRVCSLGWTPERFDAIDSGLRRGRANGSAERVGKKYQWIALYEVLGTLADNFLLRPEFSSESPGPYEYAEQLIWRDIDATVLARRPSAPSAGDDTSWFSPVAASLPKIVVSDYPTDMGGVPDPIDLLSVTSPDGERWLNLLSYPRWRQQHPLEVQALHPPTREVSMRIEAFLTPLDSLEDLKGWAVGKDWSEDRTPEVADVSNVLLGSHPMDPQWAGASGTIDEWEARRVGEQLKALVTCGAQYAGTGTDRDASSTEETTGFVPTTALFDLLNLQPGVDFVWHDASGVAVLDPSAMHSGPQTLLVRRDLRTKLIKAGYTLFWVVSTAVELSPGGWGTPGDDYRWVGASASYLLEDDAIQMVDSRAARYRPGPHREVDLAWTAKPSDR